MIFERRKGERFGFIGSDKLFLNETIYMFGSRINSYIDSKGYMGPINCGSISLDKKLSIIKAFSESVERRAIAFGAKESKYDRESSYAYDILNNSITTIPNCMTRYRLSPPYMDTTGTAAHSNPKYSVFAAISELIEKNAVFLLWYGKIGKRVETNVSSPYREIIEKQGYEITFLLVDYFSPLKVIVTVAYSETAYLKYKFGIGSSIHLMDAIDKSLSEACFLGTFYESKLFNQMYGIQDRELEGLLEWNQDKSVLEYLNELKKLPLMIFGNECIDDNTDPKIVRQITPKWVKELLIISYPQKIKNELFVVKAYSEQLYNHIPKKSYLDLNKEMNKQTIQLDEKDLDQLPDCPIV